MELATVNSPLPMIYYYKVIFVRDIVELITISYKIEQCNSQPIQFHTVLYISKVIINSQYCPNNMTVLYRKCNWRLCKVPMYIP